MITSESINETVKSDENSFDDIDYYYVFMVCMNICRLIVQVFVARYETNMRSHFQFELAVILNR